MCCLIADTPTEDVRGRYKTQETGIRFQTNMVSESFLQTSIDDHGDLIRVDERPNCGWVHYIWLVLWTVFNYHRLLHAGRFVIRHLLVIRVVTLLSFWA
jgi:hypothetical protein